MGPMFYLVQSHGARDPISAVVLADWPPESFPRPTSGPCAEPVGRFGLRWIPPSAEACCARKKKLGGKFAPSGRCALCSASDQVDLLRRRLEEKQRKYAHRTGQRIFLPAVTWGFSLRCSSSRRTSTQAKKIRGAGGGQRGQREPRRAQR